MAGPAKPDLIRYDGDCALCHGFVRFVLRHDRAARFQFAPQQGEERIFNSIIVETANGERFYRSDASLYVLDQMGGFWTILSRLGRQFPSWLRDAVYQFVARIRYRIFGRTARACPIVPPELRGRFVSGGSSSSGGGNPERLSPRSSLRQSR
jgi:predicted DCC family thiol-disulfide oxidoreductase YuxK